MVKRKSSLADAVHGAARADKRPREKMAPSANTGAMKGGSSPDLCVKAEEAPRLRLGCLGDLLFLEE